MLHNFKSLLLHLQFFPPLFGIYKYLHHTKSYWSLFTNKLYFSLICSKLSAKVFPFSNRYAYYPFFQVFPITFNAAAYCCVSIKSKINVELLLNPLFLFYLLLVKTTTPSYPLHLKGHFYT